MKKGEKHMYKKPLILVSIGAVVLLVLGSLSNVVGYQSVQTSQQNAIKERINQKELLFQTFVDMVNNKEIQRIIFLSQMSKSVFPGSSMTDLTKSQLRQMYAIGLILSKVISKSRLQSMVQQHQLIKPAIQKEITAVIEKDAKLKGEITQLSGQSCNCGIESNFTWNFPVLCILVFALFVIAAIFGSGYEFVAIIFLVIAGILRCRWIY
jgi:uncharacterized membrane protein